MECAAAHLPRPGTAPSRLPGAQVTVRGTRSLPSAALAVVRFPAPRSPAVLAAVACAAGAAIEGAQWLLPPGRVVSPPDALLDATGALAADLAVAALVSPVSGGFAAARRG